MRLLYTLPFAIALGCNDLPAPEADPPTKDSAPEYFLGLPDDRSRKVGDDNPKSPIADVETMTKVQPATYADYQKAKKDGQVRDELRRDGQVYFAVRQARHVPLPGGVSASVEFVERFKAPIPAQ